MWHWALNEWKWLIEHRKNQKIHLIILERWWITWNIQKKYKDGFIRLRQVKLCVYSNYVRYHLDKFWRMHLRMFLQAKKDSPGYSLLCYILWSILWWSLSSIYNKKYFCHLKKSLILCMAKCGIQSSKWQKHILSCIEDKDHHKMDQII